MAISAKLQLCNFEFGIVEHEYDLVSLDYTIDRHHNGICPDGRPMSRSLRVSVIAPDKADIELFHWYISQCQMSGSIIIDLSDAQVNGRTKRIDFHDAVCREMSETYDISSTSRRVLSLDLVSDTVETEDQTYHASWLS